MAINFPVNPSINDTYTVEGVIYEYTGNRIWTIKRGKIFTATAKDLGFDNTGSQIKSLNTEDAIKQVHSEHLNLSKKLSNVNNTSDLDKPISKATQEALDLKLNKTAKAIDSAKLNGKNPDFYLDFYNLKNVPSVEYYQDLVGAMVSGNSETGSIAVTYDDTNGKLNFKVGKVTDSELLDGYDHSQFAKLETSNHFDQNQTFARDVVVNGNLVVKGNTTSMNTEEVRIDDNIITLNSNVTGTPTENAGIEVERGNAKNVSILWSEGTDTWRLTKDGTTFYDIIHRGNLNSKIIPAEDPFNTNNKTVQNQLNYLNGRINEANGIDIKFSNMFTKSGSDIIFKGNLIPETDQLSIGAPDKQIKELFVSADTIYLGDNTQLEGTAITIDGGKNPTSMSEQPTLLASRLVARPFTYNPGGGDVTMRPSIEFQDEMGVSNPISFNSATGEFSFDTQGNYGQGSIVAKNAKLATQETSGNARFNGNVQLGYSRDDKITIRGILDVQTPVTFAEAATLGDGNDTITVNAGSNNNFIVNAKNISITEQGITNVNGLNVGTPQITLHTNTTTTPTEDVYITVDRGNKASVSVRWNEVSDKWELTKDGINYYEIADATHIQALQKEIASLKAGKLNKYNREVATSFTLEAGDSVGVKAVGGIIAGTLPNTIKVGDTFHIINSKRSDSEVRIINENFTIYDLYDTYNPGDGIALERGDMVTLVAVSSTELEIR